MIGDGQRAALARARLAPFFIGVLLALPLAAFVVGLGAGARRRGGGPPGPWAMVAASIGTLLFVGLVLGAALRGQAEVAALHERGAPALAMVRGQPSDVRDPAWIVIKPWNDELRAAYGAWRPLDRPPPSDAALRGAFSTSEGFPERAGRAFVGERAEALLVDGSLADGLLWPVSTLWRSSLLALALGLLGWLLGWRGLALWRPLHLVVPGSSRWLGPVGALALALVAAALVKIAGLAVQLERVPQWSMVEASGFALLKPEPLATPSAAWAWPLLAAALAVHALGVWLDRRGERRGGAGAGVGARR
jgi:hypothetical protein